MPQAYLLYTSQKSGIFKMIPVKLNPVNRFFDNIIDLSDFKFTSRNLSKSMDLMGICHKL